MKNNRKLNKANKPLEIFVRIVFISIVIACNIRIYQYIEKMEKENCTCAQNNLVKFLKPSTLVAASVLGVKLLVSFTGKSLSQQKFMRNIVGKSVSMLLGIYLLTHSACLVIYFLQLVNKNNCDCSNERDRNLLLYPLILIVLVFMVALIVALVMVAYHS